MPDTFVAEVTGLLDLGGWHDRIPGLRVIARDEPGHPRYRKRATERERQLGRRYQLIAINAKVGQIAWPGARHRSHVHVENDVKQAKALGRHRWPSRRWSINLAWTQIVAMAANRIYIKCSTIHQRIGSSRSAQLKLERITNGCVINCRG